MDFGRDCSAVIGCRVSGSVVYTNASSGAVLAAHGGMALDLRHTAYDAAVEYHRCRLLAVGAMERAAVLTEPSATVAALESRRCSSFRHHLLLAPPHSRVLRR